MNSIQQIEVKSNGGLEFMKIYGITLVSAFVLMFVIQFRMNTIDINPPAENTHEEIELPAQTPSPMANAKDILPLHKLKNIFVNLSF
jgi:hypothetical protein